MVRLHVPLITNEQVRFTGWDLDGRLRAGVMQVGGCFYLDTRKPHTAFNGGESVRLHFVADVIANDGDGGGSRSRAGVRAGLAVALVAPVAPHEDARSGSP